MHTVFLKHAGIAAESGGTVGEYPEVMQFVLGKDIKCVLFQLFTNGNKLLVIIIQKDQFFSDFGNLIIEVLIQVTFIDLIFMLTDICFYISQKVIIFIDEAL